MSDMTPQEARSRLKSGAHAQDSVAIRALEALAARGQALNCSSADGVVDDLTSRHPDQVRMEQLEDDVTWIKITVNGRDHIFHTGPVEYIGHEEDDYDVHGDVDE